MATRRRYALYAAATIAMAALGGCALVAGLFEPRPITCSNGVLDPGETKADCGGECPKCDKEACASNDECASLQCVDGHCRSPVCDQGSSDVECFQCHRCANGDECASNLDCASGLCAGGKCVACAEDGQCPGSSKCSTGGLCVEVTCNNGVQNTTELGVDCGGECATFLGKACADGGSGGMGTGGTGTGGTGTGGTGTGGTGTGGTGDPCMNTMKDLAETDVDCGGGTCPTCSNGKACASSTDCMSGRCDDSVCASCTDGMQSGAETAVDCGGVCPPCEDNQPCQMNGDCISGHCNNLSCAAPVCDDGIKNGSETDVDCGGTCGGTCALGKACAGNGDCNSGACSAEHVCVLSVCANGVKDGDETDIDCGGSCVFLVFGRCAAGKGCMVNNDCGSLQCDTTTHKCLP